MISSELKLGKAPARVDPRTLRLSNYIPAGYTPPPVTRDNSGIVPVWGMLGNDQYGDCVVAAYAHMLMLWAKLAGVSLVAPVDDVINIYLKLTGGVDRGLVELDFLNWCRQNVFDSNQILGFASIPTHDTALMEHAISMFGAVFRGILLPASAASQLGGLWDLTTYNNVPGSWGGHATIGVGYDRTAQQTKDITWGAVQKATYRFWQSYQDECYVLIPTYPIPGFDRDGFIRDLQAIGQYVGPQPAPAPPVPPTPVPPTPPTPPKPPVPPTPVTHTPMERLQYALSPYGNLTVQQYGVASDGLEFKTKGGLYLSPRVILRGIPS